MVRFVVAIGIDEAKMLAPDFGWDTEQEAKEHLALVKSPPTDIFYADKYQVWCVAVDPKAVRGNPASVPGPRPRGALAH